MQQGCRSTRHDHFRACPRPLSQICFLRAATAKAFTMVFAGFAFTTTVLPNISRLPALVAGFTRVLIMQRPGTVNFPTFFTSAAATPARLSKTLEIAVFFISHASATACAIAPLDMAGAAAFAPSIALGAMAWNFERRQTVEGIAKA